MPVMEKTDMNYEIGRNWETKITPQQRAMGKASFAISAAAMAVALLYWFA